MTTTRLPKPYTRSELGALYDAASVRPEVSAAMRFLHDTGLRISEACAISTEEARSWPLPPRWCRRPACPRHRASFRTIGKGDRERIVMLTPAALRAARVLVDNSSNGHMMPWTDRGVRYLFEQVGQAAGVHCHPHRFRHTLASELVESGVPIEIVADMLGHSKTEITRLYWIASERAKVEALSRRRRFLRRR